MFVAFNSNGQDEIKKNSIMVESNFIMMTSVSYDRYVPLKERTAIILGGEYIMGTGFGWGTHWIVPEIGILAFGPKHFLEASAEFAFDVTPSNEDIEMYGRENSPGVRLAYRLQTHSGFSFRVTANSYFNIDPIFVPTIGVGFAF